MQGLHLNGWAVLVAALAGFMVGGLWYSVLFKKAWVKAMGLPSKVTPAMREKGNRSMAFAFFGQILTAFVLATFISFDAALHPQSSGLVCGLISGFMVWLGFLMTNDLGVVLWENKPVKLFLINTSHHLTSYLLMGVILGIWR